MNRVSITLAIGLMLAAPYATGAAAAAPADSSSPAALEAKLRALMRASGAEAHLQQQIEIAVARAQADAEQLLRNSAARLQPDAAFRAGVQLALDHYVAEVRQRLGTVATGASWLEVYRKAFNEDEIDQLLAFYRSPLHAREHEASEDAGVRLDGEVSQHYAAQTAAAGRAFQSTLRQLVRACRCERPASPAGGNSPPASAPAP